jgi:hypothetical protein
MKEDANAKEMGDGDRGLAGDGGDGGDGGLLAPGGDTDARPLADCPRQPVGVGAPQYPCQRDGHGLCVFCDRFGASGDAREFGLPVRVSNVVPDGWAVFVRDGDAALDGDILSNGYFHAVDLAREDSGYTFRIDADGTVTRTDEGDRQP